MISKVITTAIFWFFSVQIWAISYTWNGVFSSDWATPANWTPVGVPNMGDDVTVVAAANMCVLDGNRAIDGFVINSGTINLNGFTLQAALSVTLSGGTIQNGNFNVNSGLTDVTTLGAVNLAADAVLNVVAGRVMLNGGTYQGAVSLHQTGATNANGTGGAIFNGNFSITLSGTAYWRTNGNCSFNGNC